MASGNIENYTGRLILPGDADFDLNNSPVDQMCTIQKYSTSATNRPGGTGTVITSANGNYAGQFAMQDGKESPYYRYRNNSGEWSRWLPFVMGSIVPVTKGGTGATIPQDAKANLGLVRFVKNTGANETITLTFTGSVRAIMLFYSSNAARNGAYMLSGSTGNTQTAELLAASGITITRGTGQVSITTQYSVGFWILSLGDMDAITFPS